MRCRDSFSQAALPGGHRPWRRCRAERERERERERPEHRSRAGAHAVRVWTRQILWDRSCLRACDPAPRLSCSVCCPACSVCCSACCVWCPTCCGCAGLPICITDEDFREMTQQGKYCNPDGSLRRDQVCGDEGQRGNARGAECKGRMDV